MSDTTFAELASAVGCTGDLDKCKQPIIDAMAIDEVVDITIAAAGPDKVSVTVRRASKAGATRSATTIAAKADLDPALVASIGPLFGATTIVDPPGAAKKPPPSQGKVTTGPVVIDDEDPLAKKRPSPEKPAARPEPAARPHPEPVAKAATTRKPEPVAKAATTRKPEPVAKTDSAPDPEPVAKAATRRKREPVAKADSAARPDKIVATGDTINAAPAGTIDDTRSDRPRDRSRLYIGGVIGGGALVVTSLVLWQKASSIESDAKAAPDRTRADIDRLLELESRGDRYALWGNLTFVAGVAIAGTCGVLYFRHRHRSDSHASLAPVVLPRGGGLALTLEMP
jgi:outer membrane biosynthesis protein TonB